MTRISLIAAALAALLAPAAMANVSQNCSVPNAVKCTLSSPNGIATARVHLGAPHSIDVVNNSYRSCPRSVQVSFDPVAGIQNYTVSATECSGAQGKLTLQPKGGSKKLGFSN